MSHFISLRVRTFVNRDLMGYANSAIIESGSLPTYSTIREWIVRSFNRHKGVVTELLGRSLSRINVSFDAWSSRRFTTLLVTV